MTQTLTVKAEPNAFKNNIDDFLNKGIKVGNAIKLVSAFSVVAGLVINSPDTIACAMLAYAIGTIAEAAGISDAKYMADQQAARELNATRPDYYEAKHANAFVEFGKSFINPIRGFMVTSQKRKPSLG